MNDLVIHLLSSGGPVGVALAMCYLYIRQQHNELREVSEKRVEDNKAMVSKLLDLNDKWNETINAQIEAGEAQKQLLVDLKTQLMVNEAARPRR